MAQPEPPLVSKLPVELLHNIMSLAADRPPDHRPELEEFSPFNPYVSHYEHPARYLESLATNSSFALVSHQWYAVATPLLYEHIIIKDEKHLSSFLSFCETLETRSAGSPDQQDRLRALNSFTKRLDLVLLHDLHDSNPSTDPIFRLLERYPRLTTLVAAMDDKRAQVAMLASLPRSLKYLHFNTFGFQAERDLIRHRREMEWIQAQNPHLPNNPVWDPERYRQRPWITAGQWGNFMDEHPNLEIISVPFRFFEGHSIKDASPGVSDPQTKAARWQSVRTLLLQHKQQLEGIGKAVPAGAFPNLKTVKTAREAAWDKDRSGHLRSFLQSHGQSITTIGLVVGSAEQERRPESLASELAEVNSLCPDIHTINLTVSTDSYSLPTFERVRSTIRLQQITTVGLEVSSYYEDKTDDIIMAITRPWSRIFPKVETIRILRDVESAKYFASIGKVKKQVLSPGRWTAQPIVVEDREGRCMAKFSQGFASLAWPEAGT